MKITFTVPYRKEGFTTARSIAVPRPGDVIWLDSWWQVGRVEWMTDRPDYDAPWLTRIWFRLRNGRHRVEMSATVHLIEKAGPA